MKTLSASLCSLVLTLLCFEATGEDRETDQKKKTYASAAADCDKAISRKKSSLAESYSSEVWGLKQRFQNDGNLENALAADKEWSRSIRREPLTAEDLVESPKELRAMQDAYVDRQDRVEQEVAAEVLGQLQREATELAKAGNLTDGRVLQQEIDKIKRLYLSSAKSTGREMKDKKRGKDHPTEAEDPIVACEEAIRQKRVAIQAQYVGELEAMEKSFQAKGALEDVFAAKGERKRFMETPLLAEENLAETPNALRELQRKYLELQQNVTTSVAEEFVARLEQQKQSLTIEGKLEDAVRAKTAAEKLSQRFLHSHRIFLSDLQERNAVVGHGAFGKNGERGYDNLKIIVGGKKSAKGISIHPPSYGTSKVTYDIPDGYTHFEGYAAIADYRDPQKTPVIFRVLNERGVVLWKTSGIVRGAPPEKCSIALNAAKALTLAVECPGDFTCAHAVWIDPQFVK